MNRLAFRCVAWCPVLLLICSSVVVADYREPDLSVQVFTPDHLSLSSEDRTVISSGLAEFVRSLDPKKESDMRLAEKALAISLRLDPANRSANVVNGQLKQGVKPKPKEGAPIAASLGNDLTIIAKALKGKDDADDQILAGYLFDLAVALSPANEDAVYENELSHKKGGGDWSKIVRAEPPQEKTDQSAGVESSEMPSAPPPPVMEEPLRTESKVEAIVSTADPALGLGSRVMEIVARASAATSFGVHRENIAGQSGMATLGEATELTKLRLGDKLRKNDITLIYDDQNVRADKSAGIAFSAALISLVENIDLDANFAVTGGIASDGSVQKGAGIPEKLHAASSAHMKYAGIPSENAINVDDAAILFSPGEIVGMQILGFGNISDALNAMRTDRPKEIADALAAFAKIQEEIAKGGLTAVRSPEMRKKLEAVLKSCPDHLSAQYLLRFSQGAAPSRLSSGTSFEKMMAIAAPIFRGLKKSKKTDQTEKPDAATRLGIRTSDESMRSAQNRLQALEPIIAAETTDMYYAMQNLFNQVDFVKSRFDLDDQETPNTADEQNQLKFLHELMRKFWNEEAKIDTTHLYNERTFPAFPPPP